MKVASFRQYLLPLYAVAALFPRLLPGKVQLTEIIFVLAFAAFIRQVPREIKERPWLAGALGFYGAVNALSGYLAYSGGAGAGAMLEGLARCYLATLVLLVLAHVRTYGHKTMLTWWFASTLSVALVSMGFYTVRVLGGPDPFEVAQSLEVYPYFGQVYRLTGAASTSGMFYMLLLPGMFLAWEHRKSQWSPLFVLLFAGVLTLAKENVLFPIGLLLVTTFYPVLARLAAFLLLLFLLFVTHVLVLPPGNSVGESYYVSGKVLGTFGGFELHETTYLLNKRTAIEVGRRHPWLGVGPGQYAEATAVLTQEGAYPARVGKMDPHSAWLGAFAETGYAGLLALLLLVVVLYRPGPGVWRYLPLCLLLYLLVSIFKDVMNFRSLWVLIGLYAVVPAKQALRS